MEVAGEHPSNPGRHPRGLDSGGDRKGDGEGDAAARIQDPLLHAARLEESGVAEVKIERMKMPARYDGSRVPDKFLCEYGHLHPSYGHAVKCHQRRAKKAAAKKAKGIVSAAPIFERAEKQPKCSECDGRGGWGNSRKRDDESEWQDCDSCSGTGREP